MFLPSTPEPNMKSFMAPILNLKDTRISAPFFGPNVWTGILQPVTGGGIPSHCAFVEIKMTFKEGGAFDFHSTFERVRDSLLQAVENAEASGQELDPENVHLDQLPAYGEVSGTRMAPPQDGRGDPPLVAPTPIHASQAGHPSASARPADAVRPGDTATPEHFEPPNEPPPGYEEAQSSGIRDQLEESVRRRS